MGFTDADWGSNIDDRRSYKGYVFYLGDASVIWESREQRTVALSTAEAEYMALTDSAKGAVYLRRFLQEVLDKTRKMCAKAWHRSYADKIDTLC